MRRVLIVGSPGRGKSTFARRLVARTGLPLTHLDELSWHPGWVRVERRHWLAHLSGALAGEAWITEGYSSSTLLRRAYCADTVVFPTPSRWQCLWRAFWRQALGRSHYGPGRAGWPSRARALLRELWTFPEQARWHLAQFQTVPELNIVVLENGGAAENF